MNSRGHPSSFRVEFHHRSAHVKHSTADTDAQRAMACANSAKRQGMGRTSDHLDPLGPLVRYLERVSVIKKQL